MNRLQCDLEDAILSAKGRGVTDHQIAERLQSMAYAYAFKAVGGYGSTEIGPLPSKVDLSSFGEVYDQGDLGSSTACAIASAVSMGKMNECKK